MVHRAQIHNRSLAAGIYWDLSCTLPLKKKLQTELSSLLHCASAIWADPYKEAPGIVFQLTRLVQSDLRSHILICIFSNRSEWFHNDQSEHVILTNQIKRVQFELFHLKKKKSISLHGTQNWGLGLALDLWQQPFVDTGWQGT